MLYYSYKFLLSVVPTAVTSSAASWRAVIVLSVSLLPMLLRLIATQKPTALFVLVMGGWQFIMTQTNSAGGDTVLLLELRKNAGMSQEYLARALGVSRQTIVNWESGKSVPTADKAVKLAELFNTTVEKLMEE